LYALGLERNRQGYLLGAFLHVLEQGGEVYCLDAGNVFDPFPLALAARTQGIPPEQVLSRLWVSRAATCHQVVSVVEEMLLPLTTQPGRKTIAVLAADSLFLDEDIPLFERQYLFRRLLEGMAEIRQAGVACLLTHSPESRGDREGTPWIGMIRRLLRPDPIPLPPSRYAVLADSP
jgi:hypothetical protein